MMRSARGAHGRRRGGFTLIEAVIVIVLLGVGIPPVMMAIRDATQRRVDAVMQTRARWLAAERLEDILADRHSSTRGWSWITTGNYPAESSVTGYPGFTRSVSIVETGASLSGAGTGYRTVTVTVSWTDGQGRAQSLSLGTVVTDYTP
jgi:Tfp pilus assembly protein PilV